MPAAAAARTLAADPASTALVMDFDGSLADIVDHPEDAVPRPDVVGLLGELVVRFARVGIVSGRPVAFLADRLPVAGLQLVGQYGLERLVDGVVEEDPRVEPWVDAVRDVADRAGEELPGVYVERKGRVAVTLHWRTGREIGPRAERWAEAAASERGLWRLPTRMAVELRPPIAVDKGDALEALVSGATTAMFAGDDHGDLAAFDALDRLRREGRLRAVVRVAVRSTEEPEALVAAADIGVDGPAGLVAFLRDVSARG